MCQEDSVSRDSTHDPKGQSVWQRWTRGFLGGLTLLLMSSVVVLVLWRLARALTDMQEGCLVLGLVAALAPSLLMVGHRLLGARRTIDVRRKEVQQYRDFLTLYVERRTHGELPPIFNREQSNESIEQEGYTRQYLLGALLLAVPFICLAFVLASDASFMPRGGLLGLALTGAGIYAYTLGLAIFRIRTAAISSEFLLSAALRVFIFMSVGFTLGSQGFLSPGGSVSSAFLYFGIGLFPYLGMDVLGRRVKQAFMPDAPGTSPLKLQYVDGITEQVAERLEELGIFDVQHLARVEPGWLSLRSLYPLSRIIDWMDQAILIAYLREGIMQARQVGIRGAIDMRTLYCDAIRAGTPGANSRSRFAQKVLQELATKSGLSQDALHAIGAALKDDILVDLLCCLESGRCLPRKKNAPAGKNAGDGSSLEGNGLAPELFGSGEEDTGRTLGL